MAASLVERMTGAMKADVKTFQEIEADPTAIGQAVTVIVIAGIASLIGNVWRIGISGGLMMLIANLCGYALWALLVVLIGTKLMPEPATKADFNEGFRVIGFTAAPGVFNVLAIIPFLGPLISFVIWIWMVVVGVVAVREVLDYSNTGRAIIVCLIAAVICWIVSTLILLPLLVGNAVLRGMAG
jgi:Yip1 domain